jgi:hypothetical protein
MNVILRYLQGVDLNVMSVTDFSKQFLYPVSNIATEYPLSVFRRPHQMILGVVDRMAGSSRWHTSSLTTNLLFFSRKEPSRLLPTGEYLPALPGGASIAFS